MLSEPHVEQHTKGGGSESAPLAAGETCSSCRPVHARARYARWNISSVPSGHYTQGRDTHAGIASGNASSTVSYLQFLQSIEKAIAVRTLESLARIELGAQGGALLERVTTTRISKSGVATTTVRERFTPPDWRADGWFLERRHPADWSRRTELVLPDHEKAAEADPLVGVHDELRLARLRQKRQGKSA